MWVFFRVSRADNSIVCGPIRPKFNLLLDIMHVLDTYKFKMDWINRNQVKVATSVFLCSRAAKYVVPGQIWSNFELIKPFMYVVITCKYETDPIKTAEKKWQHRFLHYKPKGIFPDAQGHLTPPSDDFPCKTFQHELETHTTQV